MDDVTGRAIAAAAALHDEILDAVRGRLAMLSEGASSAEALDAAREAFDEFVGPLTQVLADASLMAWLRGNASVLDRLPATADVAPVDVRVERLDWDGSPAWLPWVDAALDDLANRQIVRRAEWDALTTQARRRAFTAAGASTQAALESLRDTLVGTVEQGEGVSFFQERVLDALGTSPLSPAALDNVFRTNVAAAYANAIHQMGQRPVVRDLFPYRERLVVNDSRLTDLCHGLARSGIEGTAIYRADDPVWEHFRPPSHWRCRCGVRLLSIEDAARHGLVSAQRWRNEGVDPHDFVSWPALSLPRGWAPGGPVESVL